MFCAEYELLCVHKSIKQVPLSDHCRVIPEKSYYMYLFVFYHPPTHRKRDCISIAV